MVAAMRCLHVLIAVAVAALVGCEDKPPNHKVGNVMRTLPTPIVLPAAVSAAALQDAGVVEVRATDRGDGGVVDEVMRAAGEAAGREVQFSVKPPPKAE